MGFGEVKRTWKEEHLAHLVIDQVALKGDLQLLGGRRVPLLLERRSDLVCDVLFICRVTSHVHLTDLAYERVKVCHL